MIVLRKRRRPPKGKTLGTRLTRWARRADACTIFRVAFPVIVQALEILSQDGDGKARGYLSSIKQFALIVNYTTDNG